MADKDEKTPAPKARAASKADAASESDAKAAPLAVTELPADAEIAARTAPQADEDGRFHKVFVIMGRDWNVDGPVDDMHRANQVATLQEALNRGLHPQGGARFDGAEETADSSVRLSYSVDVILAHEDEDPASAYTPKFSVDDFGGSTIQDADKALES